MGWSLLSWVYVLGTDALAAALADDEMGAGQAIGGTADDDHDSEDDEIERTMI